jgi:hypothetical protein
LKASFLLTIPGRFEVRNPSQSNPLKSLVNFKYNPPHVQIDDGPLFRSISQGLSNHQSSVDPFLSEEDTNEDVDNIELIGEEIELEKGVSDLPIDLLLKIEQPLDFLDRFLTDYCTKCGIDSSMIEEILEYFFFSTNLDQKIRRALQHYTNHSNLTLWQWIATNNPHWKNIIDKIIGISSISSSEASVERNFSRRKRLQSNLQANTNSAILLAKTRIAYHNERI